MLGILPIPFLQSQSISICYPPKLQIQHIYIPLRNPSNLTFISQQKALTILLNQSPHKNIID
jgi:hypothetical protein